MVRLEGEAWISSHMYYLKLQYMEVQVLLIISTVKGARRYASESKYLFLKIWGVSQKFAVILYRTKCTLSGHKYSDSGAY
jgi:hypothetical protein